RLVPTRRSSDLGGATYLTGGCGCGSATPCATCPPDRACWSTIGVTPSPYLLLSHRRPQRADQVTALRRRDRSQAEPGGEPAQLRRERLGHLPDLHPVLHPGRWDPQHPRGPVGLQIPPGDQPVPQQEREDVVAVHPARCRHVDLDPVTEPEQPLGAPPFPDQRVERAEQRLRPDLAGEPRVPVP